MDILIIDLNTKLVVIYYNRGNPHLFWFQNDVTLPGVEESDGSNQPPTQTRRH